MREAVVVLGTWKPTGKSCCVINVYAPCEQEAKFILWDRISLVLNKLRAECVCVIGDFNVILEEGERRGVRGHQADREMNEFGDFVLRSGLLDLVLQGRRFKWYRPNGTCKSRIDRALINDQWLQEWPTPTFRTLPQSISDHCRIVVESIQMDWGSRSFRFITAWLSHPDFLEKVKESWEEEALQGWGCFVFKEKLKRLGETLKVWNQDVFGSMEKRIGDLKHEIETLDSVDDSVGLTEEQVCRRNEASASLILQLKNRKSLLSQKARMRWMDEGDINNRFFHRVIAANRLRNCLAGLETEVDWVVEPRRVKEAVSNYFNNHFQRKHLPVIFLPEDFVETRLSDEEGGRLVRPFTEEKFKEAVWDYDSSKSPGPD